MSGIWEFVKRHRNKLTLGTVAVGGAFLLRRSLQNISSSPILTESHRQDDSVDNLQLQARRNYVYDTNQRTCDASILEILPEISSQISAFFDVEKLIKQLKNDTSLTSTQRVEIWKRIKVKQVTDSAKLQKLSSNVAIVNSRLSEYLPSNASLDSILHLLSDSNETEAPIDASTQHIFLKCSQYFITHGLTELMKRIREICTVQLEDVSLKESVNEENLRFILSNIKRRMSLLDCRHFSYLIVPQHAAKSNGILIPDNRQLNSLLVRMVEMLQSTKCRKVVSSLVDFFLDALVHSVRRQSKDETLPMARTLPLIASGFGIISSRGFDSPVQNILCSTELHEFAMHVFSVPLQVTGSIS